MMDANHRAAAQTAALLFAKETLSCYPDDPGEEPKGWNWTTDRETVTCVTNPRDPDALDGIVKASRKLLQQTAHQAWLGSANHTTGWEEADDLLAYAAETACTAAADTGEQLVNNLLLGMWLDDRADSMTGAAAMRTVTLKALARGLREAGRNCRELMGSAGTAMADAMDRRFETTRAGKNESHWKRGADEVRKKSRAMAQDAAETFLTAAKVLAMESKQEEETPRTMETALAG